MFACVGVPSDPHAKSRWFVALDRNPLDPSTSSHLSPGKSLPMDLSLGCISSFVDGGVNGFGNEEL